MDPMKMKAKLSALKDLKKTASEMMSDDLDKGLKKVTVAADDDKGLKMGLDKAKDMLDMKKDMGSEPKADYASPAEEDAEAMMDEEESEMPDMESCDTPEEIDAAIKMLLEKKKQLMAQE